MQKKIHTSFGRWLLSSALILLFLATCNIIRDRLNNLQQVNLVANNGNYVAGRIDPNFINAWGFDFSPFGPAFISSNGTGTSVVYGTAGDERRLPILIPGAGEIPAQGAPAGVVFNETNDFQLSTNFAPARFIYGGSDGVITAWNADDAAVVILDNSANASYTGIAIANSAGINYLYLANFKEGKIEVYDSVFNEVSMTFTDPGLPAGYAPYNIRSIDGKLYVTYAKGTNGNVETGAGKGYVDVYNTDGSFSKRFASGGKLNAPWGLAKATADFNFIANQPASILVGNYGDGKLNAYSLAGSSLGSLVTASGPVSIAGLRNIAFAPDSVVAEHGKLFFTAGPNGGQDALFGYLQNVEP